MSFVNKPILQEQQEPFSVCQVFILSLELIEVVNILIISSAPILLWMYTKNKYILI